MEFPSAYIIAINGMHDEAYSARPDAPVVPHIEPGPRAHPIRLAVANALERAARRIAPPECSPSR
jgi:hypothetical protein